MTLDDNEALKILKASEQVPPYITALRKQSKTLKALVIGEDFQTELSKIEHIEKSEDKWQARKKYSRSIKDLNERVLRPIDNVYSATGGSKFYDIQAESTRKKLMDNITNIRGNKSLESWLQANWMPVYHYDAGGVIFLESFDDRTYPTYKSIFSIRNYEHKGQNLEWILFERKNIKKESGETIITQRLVDDTQDRTYKVSGSTYTLIEELTFDITYGDCPGLVNSDLHLPGEQKMKQSPLFGVTEIEQEYLRDQSILTIVKFLNGFQNLIRPKIVCPKCHGTGKNGNADCKDCDKGYLVNRDVTDEIIIPIDPTNEDQNLPDATTLAAWIGLDVETWDQYRKEGSLLEILIFETLWGTHFAKDDEGSQRESATGRFIDAQAVINKLNKYSDTAERMEWQLTEWIANFLDPTKEKETNIASINYGRRFIITSPDVLLKVYTESKKEFLTPVILDDQLNDLITAKYKNDLPKLRTEIIKKTLDLYIHLGIEVVQDIYGTREAQKKGLYGEWWETLRPSDLTKPIATLEKERDKYLNDAVDQIEKENKSNQNSNGEDTNL